jgi:hypothetical protein
MAGTRQLHFAEVCWIASLGGREKDALLVRASMEEGRKVDIYLSL